MVGWRGCRPRFPRATRPRPTGPAASRARGSWARDRSGSTCTCRSARCGAATATSTPTRPTSSATGPAPRGRRTPRPRSPRSGWRGAVLGDRDLPGRHGLLRRRHADPARPGRPGRGRSRAIDAGSGWPRTPRSPPRPTPTASTAWDLAALREAGFTRVSFGMQSAVTQVLATLDRTHDPLRVPAVVDWAREAGLRAGQPRPDLRHAGGVARGLGARVEAALACAPDHVSAYSLIVEPGTALARRVAPRRAADARRRRPRRQVPAGRRAARPGRARAGTRCPTGRATRRSRCRHNELYWTGGHWWGVGPGAHSHVGGVRWWNVKHPAAYAGRLAGGASPAAAREMLDAETRRVERVLLELRLRDGLPVRALDRAGGLRSRAWCTRAVEPPPSGWC